MLDARTLATSDLVGFLGGQFEVRKRSENQYFCGRIREIGIVGNELVVRFTWVAAADPPADAESRWVKVDSATADDSYKAPLYKGALTIYVIDVVGSRWILHSKLLQEVLVLYPPDAPKLRKLDATTFVVRS